MKHTLALALGVVLIGSFGFAYSVFATVTPTLSLSATGTSDNVQITITGDPNVSVLLSYTEAGSGPQIVSLGSTNSNGSFSEVVSSATYGLTSGTLVTAMLNGTSGPESPTVAWPTVTSANALSLNQNAVVLNAGSSATITATNIGSSSLYVSSNSNPSVANVSISGSQITVSGNTAGSTTITLCQVGNTTTCPSVSAVVEQAGASQLSLSQTNASVVSGQNLPITISGGNGSYEIFNNSNANVIQASISGSVLTLSTGSTSGSSSITVCSSDLAECGVVTATAGSTSSVAISFSNGAPTVSTSQSTTINIYGPSGVQFYVSSNSSPSVVQANLSGTTLTLTGIEAGSSTISVCASTGTCSMLTATVQYVANGGNIALSQNTLSLLSGQNTNVTISGGEQPYTISGGTSSVSQETLNGTTLTVYGVAPGTSSVNVCSAGGGCILLLVTVNGANASSVFSMSQNNVSLVVGQNSTISLSGNGSYYLSSNTTPTVASVTVSGSSAVVDGLSPGNTNATICESGGSCATLIVTINSATPTTVQTSPTPTTVTTPAYTFTEYLAPGSQDAEVTELQNVLASQGDFSATATGYYGDQTEAAVIKFQADHDIDQLGVVGPATRSALNQIENTTASSNTTSSSGTSVANMTLSQLQAEVQSLESQLTQVLNRISQLTGQ
jgi:peptidoglycan hydrolase-like protein with peptidoglycan-binding domain